MLLCLGCMGGRGTHSSLKLVWALKWGRCWRFTLRAERIQIEPVNLSTGQETLHHQRHHDSRGFLAFFIIVFVHYVQLPFSLIWISGEQTFGSPWALDTIIHTNQTCIIMGISSALCCLVYNTLRKLEGKRICESQIRIKRQIKA